MKNETKGVEGKKLKFATKVVLENTPLFRTSTYPSSHRNVTGVFYLYDGVEYDGRYKIVSSKRCVRYRFENMVVVGFITKEDALKCASI